MRGQTTISVGVGVSCDLGNKPEHYSVEIEPFKCDRRELKRWRLNILPMRKTLSQRDIVF